MPKPKALEYSHKTTKGQVIWKTGVIKVRQKTLTKSNHTKYLSVQAQTQKINETNAFFFYHQASPWRNSTCKTHQ